MSVFRNPAFWPLAITALFIAITFANGLRQERKRKRETTDD